MKERDKKTFWAAIGILLLILLVPAEFAFAPDVLRSVDVGQFPVSLGITPDGEKLYVTNAGDNTVSVIETERRRGRHGGHGEEVIDTIEVGEFPTRVAISPDGARAWVANGTSNTVSVIDVDSDEVIASIPVGEFPLGIAANPNGLEVYTANSMSDTITVIDTSTLSAVASVSVGTFPSSVVVSPDGLLAYVANGDSNSVSVVDLGLRVVTDSINVDSFPLDLTLNPSGTLLFVANADSDTVSVIDTANKNVIGTISTGYFPSGVQVKPDGSELYVANTDSDSAKIFDTSNNTLVETLLVGDFPLGLTFKPNSDYAYTVNSGSDSITVIDPDSDDDDDDESDTLFVAHTNELVGDDIVWGVLCEPGQYVEILGSTNQGRLQSISERIRRGREIRDEDKRDVFSLATGNISQYGTFIYFIDYNILIIGRFYFLGICSDDAGQEQNVSATNIASITLPTDSDDDEEH